MDTTVYNTEVSGGNIVKLATGRSNIKHAYKFTLTGLAAGGATITTPELTFNTVCGPLSFDSAQLFTISLGQN